MTIFSFLKRTKFPQLELNWNYIRARRDAQWRTAPAALPEDWNSGPSFHTGWLITTCNSNSREHNAFFWPPGWPYMHVCWRTHARAHKHTYTYTQNHFLKKGHEINEKKKTNPTTFKKNKKWRIWQRKYWNSKNRNCKCTFNKVEY